MSKINISGVIDETMIKRFQGLASGKQKDSLAQQLAGRSQPAAGLSDSLRVGARTFSNAVKNVNSVINLVNISQATLEKLSEMTDKLITITGKASEGGIGPDARNQFDRQFRKIGRDFIKAIKVAEVSDKNILSREGLSQLFTAIGLDPEKSGSIAEVFARFVAPDKDRSSFLASEFSKSKKPVYIPPDAYGRGGSGADDKVGGKGIYEKAKTVVKGEEAIHALARDLNNDQFLDLITTSSNGTVSVRMGSGEGSFGTAKTYSQQGLILGGAETTADFNGDGKIDLGAALDGQNGVALALGNGDGTFKNGPTVSTSQPVKSVRSLFVDQGPSADLAALSADGSSIEILKGLGDGQFQSSGTITLQGVARDITVNDIDRDGIADIIALRNDGNAEILKGRGDGSFAASQIEAGVAGTTALQVADFDGDGVADLGFAQDSSGEITVKFGENGAFVDPVKLSAGREISSAVVKDINRDGAADYVVSHAQSGTISLILSNGDGTFKAPNRFFTGPQPVSVVAEDFTTDFVDDLLTVNQGDKSVSLLTGKADDGLVGSGNFSIRSVNSYGDGSGSTVGEFNRDGTTDIATAGYYIRTMFGNGDGQFATGTPYGSPVDSYSQVVSTDLDGDGNDDLVATERYGTGVSVLLGNGAGGFQAPAHYDAFSDAANSGERLKVADVNGDRVNDVLLTDPQGGRVGVMLGNSDGTLRALTSNNLQSTETIRDLSVSDFNADGKADVALSTGENRVEILYGRGNGDFQQGVSLEMGNSLRNITSGDFDGDEIVDIAGADFRSNSVVVRLGNGDGSFSETKSYDAGQSPWGLTSVDVNADGVLDLITANHDNSATVLAGDGIGGFDQVARISTRQEASRNDDISVSDVNNDGISDLVINNAGDGPAVALGEATIREGSGARSGSLGRLSKYFETIFDSERSIRSRPDAYVMLADLKELKGQIEQNVVALDQAREVVGKNLELVRAAGFAFLNLSEQISGSESAAQVAAKIQEQIRANAAAALSQAENLEPLIVAALTLDDGQVN